MRKISLIRNCHIVVSIKFLKGKYPRVGTSHKADIRKEGVKLSARGFLMRKKIKL